MMKFSLVLGLLLMGSAFTPAINAQTVNLSGHLKIPERGCVVLDQPQQVLIFGALRSLPYAAAGLRHSRAPFSEQSSPSTQATWNTQDQTRLQYTQTISLILIVAGFVGAFVSQIYFIVRAFQVSATWGVCMLLFNGITMLFFCLFQFGQARRPLGILLLSLAMIVGGVYLSNMGLGAR